MNHEPELDLAIVHLPPSLAMIWNEHSPKEFALVSSDRNELKVGIRRAKASRYCSSLVGLLLVELAVDSSIVVSLQDAAFQECPAHLVEPSVLQDQLGERVLHALQERLRERRLVRLGRAWVAQPDLIEGLGEGCGGPHLHVEADETAHLVLGDLLLPPHAVAHLRGLVEVHANAALAHLVEDGD